MAATDICPKYLETYPISCSFMANSKFDLLECTHRTG